MTQAHVPVESDVFITRCDSSQLTSHPSIWRNAKPVKASGLFNQHADSLNSSSASIFLQRKLQMSFLLSSRDSSITRFTLKDKAMTGSKPAWTRFVISLAKSEKGCVLFATLWFGKVASTVTMEQVSQVGARLCRSQHHAILMFVWNCFCIYSPWAPTYFLQTCAEQFQLLYRKRRMEMVHFLHVFKLLTF